MIIIVIRSHICIYPFQGCSAEGRKKSKAKQIKTLEWMMWKVSVTLNRLGFLVLWFPTKTYSIIYCSCMQFSIASTIVYAIKLTFLWESKGFSLAVLIEYFITDWLHSCGMRELRFLMISHLTVVEVIERFWDNL